MKSVPSVSATYARNGNATKSNELGMRPMQERAYIGRRFKNDTERLEKLFEMYTKMNVSEGATHKRKAATQ